jgi:intraflagellar transport protein 46
MSKASAKSSNTTGITIRSIDMRRPDASRTLAQFCKHVLDIHSTLQPDRVLYSKKMPNPETLMDLWDHPLGMNDEMAQKNDVEKHMVQLVHKWMSPKSSMDLSNQGRVTMSALNLELKDYTRLVCILADIPVYHSGTKRNAANVQVQSRSLVESLHVLFNLYLEFKNSPHFSKYSIPE